MQTIAWGLIPPGCQALFSMLEMWAVTKTIQVPPPPGQRVRKKQVSRQVAKIIHGKCFSDSGRVMRCVAAWGDCELGGPVLF